MRGKAGPIWECTSQRRRQRIVQGTCNRVLRVSIGKRVKSTDVPEKNAKHRSFHDGGQHGICQPAFSRAVAGHTTSNEAQAAHSKPSFIMQAVWASSEMYWGQ
jgi:hypothetical protein